jgi:alpha-amylase
VHEAKDANRPEARWLRGAIWRNFQVKYREVNDLHKQMLRTSDLVEAMPAGPDRDLAQDDLYAGQSNDCYWHGLFGGIYLPDLRVSALHRLIGAEDRALGGAGAVVPSGQLIDLDLDGGDEVLLANDGEIVAVKLDEGAGIGRWDIRATGHPLAAAMRRRPEAYHARLRAHDSPVAADASPAGDGGRPASIHDIVVSKQEGLSGRLQYDAYERRSGLVRLLPTGTSAREIADGTATDLVPVLTSPWRLETIRPDALTVSFDAGPVSLTKTISIGGGRLDPSLTVDVAVTNVGAEPLEALLGIEFAVMLLGGGHNPAAWHAVGGERIPHDERVVVEGIDRLASGNDQLGLAIETIVDGPANAWIAPIESVSNSEGGFELVYQGSAVVVVRAIRLVPGERASLRLEQRVAVAPAGDRAAGHPEAAVGT